MNTKLDATSLEAVRTSDSQAGFWTACAVGAFSLAILCFISGVVASIASAIGVLSASRASGRWIVCTLLAAFVFAFAGAHALDRLDEDNSD